MVSSNYGSEEGPRLKNPQSRAEITFDSRLIDVEIRKEKSSLSFSKRPLQILTKKERVISSNRKASLSWSSGEFSDF